MAKTKKKITALSPERKDPLWQMLDEKVGGRDGLLACAMASPSDKAKRLVAILGDRAFASWGTKRIAIKAGLEADEVVDLYRNMKWLETTLVLHTELPAVIQGATEDAKPSMVPCEECRTLKVDENGLTCWKCGGNGSVRKPGDRDKLSFVGEAAGLTGKKGPLVVNTNVINTNIGNQGKSFEDLMRTAVVVNKKQVTGVIEAEVVDELSR